MIRGIYIVAACALVVGNAVAQTAPKQSTFANAVSVLQAKYPKFEWQVKSAITIDINADGINDVAVLGYTNDTAAVGVVLGSRRAAKPVTSYMDFMRGDPSVERSMSGRNGTLKAVRQAATLQEALDSQAEGYRACARCYEVEVVGDEGSDQIFIYWDTVSNSLNWWRV